MISTSPFGKINGADYFKTARGALVYFVGYVLTATANNFAADLSSGSIDVSKLVLVDFAGVDETQIIMGVLAAGVASLIELGRRLMTNYRK